MLQTLMADNKTTGTNQEPWLVEYARLNIARMNRLDKTFAVPQKNWHQIQKMPNELWFLTISEGWCGDAAQIIPVIDKMVAAKATWVHKIILRDEHLPVMDRFLTNGTSRSIPVTIILRSDTMDVLGWWGPRPTGAQAVIDELKAENADFEIVKEKLHGWYAKDKGQSTAAEFMQTLQEAITTLENHMAA
ncbi:MAG: thioredoxin family protein [Chitinophagaceae bacterium]|nr:thioredoxin family protein [Chitinophagaceae bacterium]